MSEGKQETLSKELADEIKKRIWQSYLDSDLSVDFALPFKMAADAVYSFVNIKEEE